MKPHSYFRMRTGRRSEHTQSKAIPGCAVVLRPFEAGLCTRDGHSVGQNVAALCKARVAQWLLVATDRKGARGAGVYPLRFKGL